MAFWLELKCDARKKGCYSDMNNDPITMSGGKRTQLLFATKYLEREAIKLGWKKVRGGFNCPHCKEA